MKRISLLASLFVASLCLSSCESRPEEDSDRLATVGNEEITTADFTAYCALIPDALKKGDIILEINRNLLETLIDKRLLLLEARATDVAEDPRFKNKLAMFERSRLIGLYRPLAINRYIEITPEEIEEQYHATHRDRALRFGGVLVETEEEALEVEKKLKAGADLATLAAAHSLHEASAQIGGDLGKYLTRDQVDPTIARGIFHLPVGAISPPIAVPYKGRKLYVVFAIRDEVHAPLELSEGAIRKELATRKIKVRYQALVDSLKREYAPQIQPDAILRLNALSREASSMDALSLSAADAALLVCTYRNGQITLEDLLPMATSLGVGPSVLSDSSLTATFTLANVVPLWLFAEEAKAMHLDQDPDYIHAVETHREELLLSVLRYREVDQYVTASEEEARTFFDTHPESFKKPETTQLVEILASSDELAQQLRKQIEEGADPRALARQYTIREGMAEKEGRIDLSILNLAQYQHIYAAAQKLPVGSVAGPIFVDKGYSVFKVIDRVTGQRPYDADSRRRSHAYVRIRKAKEGYVQFVQDLRQKYPIEIFEDPLADLPDPRKSATP